ncbi:hypothetical protein Droror1_Dr00022898 [Drosera rotundifolia]
MPMMSPPWLSPKSSPGPPLATPRNEAMTLTATSRVGEEGGKGSWVRVRVRKEMLSMRRGKKREVMVRRVGLGLRVFEFVTCQEILILCQNVVGFSVFIVPGFGSIAMEDTGNDLRKLSESISLRRTGSVEANEKFLLRLKSRLDRVGIDIPKIEVRFEHLEVEAEAYVGSRALPSFLNFTTNIFEVVPALKCSCCAPWFFFFFYHSRSWFR